MEAEIMTKSAMLAGTVFLHVAVGIAFSADLPADVAAFVEDRQQCDHFRGEDPYDAERRAEIDAMLDRYCVGSDNRLAELKAKYRDVVPVVSVLDTFEERIEFE
jgi:hypothetical protein